MTLVLHALRSQLTNHAPAAAGSVVYFVVYEFAYRGTVTKIIHLATTLERDLGGIARSVPRLALALAEEGERTTLVAPEPREPTFTPEELPGVEVKLGRSVAEVKGLLAEAVRWAGPDAILHHAGVWAPLNHYVATLGRDYCISVICSPRGMLGPGALRHKRFKKCLAWHVYARRDMEAAACLHATADLEADNIRRTGLQVPLAVVPNGIDVPEWREKPAPGPARRRLLFLSRLHPKKGLEDLIRAFARLAPENWELIIAGNDEGGYRTKLENLVASYVSSGAVSFPGAIADADKWDLYRSADLFVLPSYSENFGLVVGEALACGTPVITTRETPWNELEEERCGWWISAGEEPLFQKLKEVIALSPGELRERGKRGRKLIERRYTWPGVARQMVEVYRKVLDKSLERRA